MFTEISNPTKEISLLAASTGTQQWTQRDSIVTI